MTRLALKGGTALPLPSRPKRRTTARSVRIISRSRWKPWLEGLEHPWGIAILPDDRLLVTERNPGTIRLISADGSAADVVHEVEDLFRYDGETERSQAGLFDITLHPDFDDNGYVYWAYSRETDRGAAVVVQRGVWNAEEGALGEIEDIWVMQEDDQDSSGLHFGGRMAWGQDGMLFLSIGERRNLERAQDLEDQAGAVLRMTDAGEAPDDNPDWDEAANEYLFTAGNRNIQAMTVNARTGELWAADHGPQGGDEINHLIGGNNYGWPFITGGEDYSGAPLGVGTAMEGKISAVSIRSATGSEARTPVAGMAAIASSGPWRVVRWVTISTGAACPRGRTGASGRSTRRRRPARPRSGQRAGLVHQRHAQVVRRGRGRRGALGAASVAAGWPKVGTRIPRARSITSAITALAVGPSPRRRRRAARSGPPRRLPAPPCWCRPVSWPSGLRRGTRQGDIRPPARGRHLRHAQQLDPEPHVGGVADVLDGDALDPLDGDTAKVDPRAEGDGGQQRQLVARVDAAHVERRVGLEIAQAASLPRTPSHRAAPRFPSGSGCSCRCRSSRPSRG
jgi:glucose/arabinose dehydrogenase